MWGPVEDSADSLTCCRNAANIISIGRKVLGFPRVSLIESAKDICTQAATTHHQVFARDSNLPDPALGDSDCVELCGAVEQARLPVDQEHQKLHFLLLCRRSQNLDLFKGLV